MAEWLMCVCVCVRVLGVVGEELTASEAIRMLARSAVTREAAAACCLLLLLKEDAPECETRKNAFLAP